MQISQGFYPDHAAWAAADYTVDVTPPSGAAIVVVPRAKALARSMVARACALAGGGIVVIDGAKTDGIDSLYRDVRKIVGDVPSITKAHGRLFWFAADARFTEWAAPPPAKGPDGFYTTAGVFSESGVDRGSALLAAALPLKLGGRVADLGAGWGYLSHHILRNEKVTHLDLIEAEELALDCARLNVTDPRAAFQWADATDFKPAGGYDAIVSNPPFHTSRTAEPQIGRAFIGAAAGMLQPKGQFWMVANRHLPYEDALRDRFGKVDEAGGDSAFKIFHARHPKR